MQLASAGRCDNTVVAALRHRQGGAVSPHTSSLSVDPLPKRDPKIKNKLHVCMIRIYPRFVCPTKLISRNQSPFIHFFISAECGDATTIARGRGRQYTATELQVGAEPYLVAT